MESTQQNTPGHITIGQILGTRGLEGLVRVRVLTDVEERFQEGVCLNCGVGTFEIIEVSHSAGDQVVLRLDGVTNASAAQKLTGAWITAEEQLDCDLPENEYYHYQLVGLTVKTHTGELLGIVTDIIETGSNDVYVVDGTAGQILLPAISQVIKGIDLESGTMSVVMLEGLR